MPYEYLVILITRLVHILSTGIVNKMINKKIEAFRSDAKVKWKDSEARYPVGRDGRCDLKFVRKGEGPSYYEDHLPTVSRGKNIICLCKYVNA